MKQTCAITGLSYDTLKFYCNEKLIPNTTRDSKNHRTFTDANIDWIKHLIQLRNCNMSIPDIKTYITLCQAGPSTIPDRQRLLAQKTTELHQQISALQSSLQYINQEQQHYRDVLSGKLPYHNHFPQAPTAP